MYNSRVISIDNVINPEEYSELISVLTEYLITPVNIERKRSAYKVICEKKTYCLKKLKHGGEGKILKGYYLSEYLKSNGFFNVARYIKTAGDKICVKRKHNYYYLTDWIDGRESNFDDIEELKNCALLLANFHVKSKGFIVEKIKINSNIKNWPEIFQNKRDDLETFREMIENKKIRSTFDSQYYDSLNSFIVNMNDSITLLENSSYMDISHNSMLQNTVCHDSFYYQNILVRESGKMYVIDLDSTIYDIHVCDLAKFIRRVLHRGCYSWNFETARALIEEYNNINPLSEGEYELLLAFIIFPHRFWKLGVKRYVKRKKWTDEKYAKKLKKIISYSEIQAEFIQKFKQFYIEKGTVEEEKKEE